MGSMRSMRVQGRRSIHRAIESRESCAFTGRFDGFDEFDAFDGFD